MNSNLLPAFQKYLTERKPAPEKNAWGKTEQSEPS
jgi:hypothetical protein